MAYIIEKGLCVNCGYCEFVCPFSAISSNDYYCEIDGGKCKSCAQCFDACIKGAIRADENTRRIERVEILKEKCIGCSLCQRFCTSHAIQGILKQPFSITASKCIKCGICLTKCKKDAILVTYR